MMNDPWHLYLMAGIYLLAGLMHFLFPGIYLRIMPPYLPSHRLLVYASGVVEVVLGAGLCFPPTRNPAIYGIILMLTVFLLVHFNMLTDPKAASGLPQWILIIRIPLQFGLAYWAYTYVAL